jgi:hypothetical protein
MRYISYSWYLALPHSKIYNYKEHNFQNVQRSQNYIAFCWFPIRISSSFRACLPRRKSIKEHIPIMNTPINISAPRMPRGGFAVGGARKAPPTRTNRVENKFPLNHRPNFALVSGHRHTKLQKGNTHENQSNAELPSEFLVTSQPSSSPTGNIVSEPTPMMDIIANSPPVFPGLTAHIKLNQAPAITGTMIFDVIARWWVSTRSKSGAVIIAAINPERRSAAPINPETVSE